MVKGLEMAALDAEAAQVAELCIEGGDIPALGPDAFTLKQRRGAEGITIVGAAVADFFGPVCSPVAVYRMHEALPVRQANDLFCLLFADSLTYLPV